MTQNDGEKELVLGNRQLLSFFFVVVALCGVFFAIGYVIGRNSARVVVAEDGAPPPVAEGQRSPLPAASTDTAPPIPSTEPLSTQTKPALETPAGSPAPFAAEPAPVNSNRIVPVTIPEKGVPYLQVTALARPDAEAVVRTLKEQGFPAILTESSKEGFFRVLVGPYRETAQLSVGKDRLRALGFANTIVHRQ